VSENKEDKPEVAAPFEQEVAGEEAADPEGFHTNVIHKEGKGYLVWDRVDHLAIASFDTEEAAEGSLERLLRNQGHLNTPLDFEFRYDIIEVPFGAIGRELAEDKRKKKANKKKDDDK
jgi:hypothetical protein